MDSKGFLKLAELLEQESVARIAAKASKASEIAALLQRISEQNASFGKTVQDLNATIQHLNETISILLEENKLLKGPKKNSGNSSVPPSKDQNRVQRTNSLRGSSGKSSGGQKGHEGSTLKMSTTPDHIIEHRPGFCNCCGLDLNAQQAELASRRQVIDIPILRPSYTEHRIYRNTCTCGHITNGTFPSGIDAPIIYGQQTTALIAYLHTRQYIPLARISEFFSSVYGMAISQGTVCGILDRFAEKALPAFALIKQALSNAKVIGADETGMKENGKLKWFWTWQSQFATYITASKNRGFETVKAHFPAGFPSTIAGPAI
ncbi:IS66 family transposase [Arcticibacter eurypsychrophilus]|uniref:IS66 family transposase n=1 Tax=Arcticibacter eurypsychrophilus TaxID=1434752 RepID=UPI00084D3E13|nr:transposase [Arcticibacter eurypsychrophilus]